MVATYRLNAADLKENILKSINDAFGSQEVEIIVRNIDDTDHLMSTQANREHLEEAKKRTKDRKNIVSIDLETLD